MKKTIEHLVAAVNQDGEQLYSKMHIKCNAIIANQTNKTNKIKIMTKGCNKITIIDTDRKGVGINRNQALLFAESDICILSDDDMCYSENYIEIVEKSFSDIAKADVIIYNIRTKGQNSKRRINSKIKKINNYNFMNYGAARIAFKRQSILNKNIWFNTQFGGGTKYSSGEDTIFIKNCLDNNLKVYTYPETIAEVDQSKSSWFNGYNEKYYKDKGALLKVLFPHTYILRAIYLAIRLNSKIKPLVRLMLLIRGAKEYEKNN